MLQLFAAQQYFNLFVFSIVTLQVGIHGQLIFRDHTSSERVISFHSSVSDFREGVLPALWYQ
jgi:hypothetical protein